jgi:porin
MRAIPAACLLCLALLCGASRAQSGASEEGPLAEFAALYTADALANVHGGLEEGSAYLDYVELGIDFDAGRALGVDGLSAYGSVIRRNQPTFSERYVGDAMIVSNIDSASPLQVLEAWLEWVFEVRGPASLRVGMYDLSSEFDVLESRALFLNSAYGIGHDLSQTGLNGPSIYPVTALGARIAWVPHDEWLLRLAVIDGVPGDPEERGRSRLHLSSTEGALVIGEAKVGGPHLRAGAGYWRYTAAFPELWPADREAPATRNDNAGGYVMAEYASAAAPGSDEPRWMAFARAGTAEERINVFDRFVSAGVTRRFAWPRGSGSYLGLAAAQAHTGGDYRAMRAAEGLATDPCEFDV